MSKLAIGDVILNNNVILAPMAGVTFGSFAACVHKASELMRIPGAVIPAVNSPFCVIRS